MKKKIKISPREAPGLESREKRREKKSLGDKARRWPSSNQGEKPEETKLSNTLILDF